MTPDKPAKVTSARTTANSRKRKRGGKKDEEEEEDDEGTGLDVDELPKKPAAKRQKKGGSVAPTNSATVSYEKFVHNVIPLAVGEPAGSPPPFLEDELKKMYAVYAKLQGQLPRSAMAHYLTALSEQDSTFFTISVFDHSKELQALFSPEGFNRATEEQQLTFAIAAAYMTDGPALNEEIIQKHLEAACASIPSNNTEDDVQMTDDEGSVFEESEDEDGESKQK